MRAIKFQGRLWALLPEGGHTIKGEIVEVVESKDKSPCCGKVREALEALLDSINPHATPIKKWKELKEPYWIGSKTMPDDESIKNAIKSLTHPQEPKEGFNK